MGNLVRVDAALDVLSRSVFQPIRKVAGEGIVSGDDEAKVTRPWLADAIASEQYELAARLRDELASRGRR